MVILWTEQGATVYTELPFEVLGDNIPAAGSEKKVKLIKRTRLLL